jgi:hypothetical protein
MRNKHRANISIVAALNNDTVIFNGFSRLAALFLCDRFKASK